MGCTVTAVIDSNSEESRKSLQELPNRFEEWEQALSRFRIDSELSLLNRSNGKPFYASPTLWEVANLSLTAYELTGGLVTPTILNSLTAAGYHSDFSLIQNETRDSERQLLPHIPSDFHSVDFDNETREIIMPSGMQLDFGGIAKGWAAQKSADLLNRLGPVLVSVGGDISISSPPKNQDLWPIGIEDPFENQNHYETIYVSDGGVATSGRDYRKWKYGNQWVHHIIDPRVGLPALTDVLTATIIAPSTVLAESAAKAVLILGGAQGLDWLAQQHNNLAGLLILEDGSSMATENFSNFFIKESSRPQLLKDTKNE